MVEIKLRNTNEHIETISTYLTAEDVKKLVIDHNDGENETL